MEKKKTIKKKIIILILIVLIITAIVVAGYIVYKNYEKKEFIKNAEAEFKNIDRKELMYGSSYIDGKDGLKNAVENGYIENIDSEYQYSNDIGCKINSFVFSDTNLSLLLDFDFLRKPIRINQLFTDVIIYDENGNIYSSELVGSKKCFKHRKEIYKEKGLKQENELTDAYSFGALYQTEDRCILQLSLESKYPVAEKLYINAYGIGYMDRKLDYVDLYDGEWNFEIDVPEKFVNRKNNEYKLKEKVDEIELQSLIISDTATYMEYKPNFDYVYFEIVDETGKAYDFYSRKLHKDDIYEARCSANKNMLNGKVYLRILYQDKIKTIELEKVN